MCSKKKTDTEVRLNSKTHTSEPLEIVHADVCGKMGVKSMGRAEYFVSFMDQQTGVAERLNRAANCCNSTEWIKDMEVEIQSLNRNNVWDIAHLLNGKKAVGSKSYFLKLKRGADGTIEGYMARLVAQGFSKQHGEDYNETFSPVERMESFRVLIALSVQNGFKLHHVDVVTAFLNGELTKDVDNKILAGRTSERTQEVKDKLSKHFEIKDVGRLHHFLGVTIEQDEESGIIWIVQPTYTTNLLST